MEYMKNQLKSFFTEHWKYLAVNAACKLKLFDKIFDGQNTTEKLIINNNWNLRVLVHLLVFLKDNEYLNEIDFTLALTEKGNLLREGNSDGLFYACLNWSDEHLSAWQNLKYSIETGKSSFEEIYGLPFFTYLNQNPERLDAYHKAMYEYAKDDYKPLTDLIDFSKHKSVMDVGGSYGAVLENIKKKNPSVECILFDLENVVEKANIPNIKKISGNFFDKIPFQSNAIILSRVLHDWDDERAIIILRNSFKALPVGGTLYVIENFAEKINDISLLSLSMTVICESYERTKSEYEKLITQANFKIIANTKLNNLQYILTALK
jgi:hypothetical protein